MNQITQSIEKRSALLKELSHRIWDLAEVGFFVGQSASLLSAALEQEGFQIERGIAGMKDAFIATFGSSGPVIGILGEYDALPAMNQAAGLKEKQGDGRPGHGCGHHALGVAGIGSALALKDYLQETGLPGTVKYFGCPAEEGGSGKAFMARDGAFGGIDAFVTWHPMEETRTWSLSTLANTKARFRFTGVSAHAAFVPHLGRSALDACELMNVGVNYLREHIIPEARVHYAYTDAGSKAPNIVQDSAELYYYVRAPKSTQVNEIFQRVANVAKGAALMTGTEVSIEMEAASSDYLVNTALARLSQDVLEDLGGVPFDAADMEEAAAYRQTLSESEQAAFGERLATYFPDLGASERQKLSESPLLGPVAPLRFSETPIFGSTDVGDASRCAPTAQITAACFPAGTVPHTWQWVAFGKSEALHKGMLHAAKAMALIGQRLLASPETLATAQSEFLEATGGSGYLPLIPKELQPQN